MRAAEFLDRHNPNALSPSQNTVQRRTWKLLNFPMLKDLWQDPLQQVDSLNGIAALHSSLKNIDSLLFGSRPQVLT